MKLRIYPKKIDVINHLIAIRQRDVLFIAQQRDRLAAMEKSVLFVPEGDKKIVLLTIEDTEESMLETESKIAFLQSHGPEEVMMELDI